MHIANPILVNAIRGDLVESFYRGAYVIMNAEGDLIDAAGDIDRLIYGRSSLKPLQALAVVTSGAMDHYRLLPHYVALCCASHNGEQRHILEVRKWLELLGFTEENLECGPIFPAYTEAAHHCIKNNELPSRLYHMCSAKHLGFLTVVSHLGMKAENYTKWDHPVQVYNRDILSQMCEMDLHQAPHGIDGCQAPVVALSLRCFAQGIAKLANPHILETSLRKAAVAVVSAMKTNPFFVAGTERFCTDIAVKSEGKILAKMGAEGVFSAVIPDRGWGIALKMDDGHLKAAEVALAKILHQHQMLEDESFLRPLILNSNSQKVGWWE